MKVKTFSASTYDESPLIDGWGIERGTERIINYKKALKNLDEQVSKLGDIEIKSLKDTEYTSKNMFPLIVRVVTYEPKSGRGRIEKIFSIKRVGKTGYKIFI